MENQHTHISGYRDLSQAEIDLMNEVKAMGSRIGELVAALQITQGVDQRWLSIGRTDMQTGLMALVRSIARPTTF